MISRLTLFCGSNIGSLPAYQRAAETLAKLFCEKQITLVYGGASIGLMGVFADCMLQHGGKVIGVIPQSLVDYELAHSNLTELHIVHSMHERKAKMFALADGFIALPGGFGTLDELFEMLTWQQLGLHRKPCGILNVANYYDKLLDFVDYITTQRFLKPAHRDLIIADKDPASLITKFENYQQPDYTQKWGT